MSQKIIDYIKKEISNEPLEDIDMQDDLLGMGVIDSIGMMKLVGFLEKEFHIEIGPEDMTVENFMNVGNIVKYLENK